jgi:bifunctional non-homologous end joining protein LigD
VRTAPMWSEGSHREIHQVLCDDRRTLLWLANQRAVELHIPFFRVGEDEPTGLVLDLDPPEGADFPVVVAAARLVRQALDDCGLAGAVKTSGSKGLHVVVPVAGSPFEDVAAATRALAGRTAALDPELATTAYIKEDRGGRVFVDSTRSGQGTIVAAYSPRIRPGLPVSFPVAWDDLDDVRPGDFTVSTAPALLGNGDPWAEALPAPQRLPADLVAEGHTIPIARVQAMHEGKRRARAKRESDGG